MQIPVLKSLTLKAKLCILTVLLIGAVMTFVGYTVISQQHKSLLLQMKETGSFLVKNLAKNAVGPLLSGDNLSLNNLISSLEARDRLQGDPAQFTQQEYEAFITRFFLEDKIDALKSYISEKENNIYIHVEKFSDQEFKKTAEKVFEEILNIVNNLNTQEQYETFFTQHPWAKFFIETLTPLDDSKVLVQIENIPDDQRLDLITKLAERIYEEIISYIKNPLIGYAIVVDKNNIIQAHPEIDKFLGKEYTWPSGTEHLEEGEEVKIQRCAYKEEPHYDFATAVVVRDINIGTALVGTVHIGLREESIVKDIAIAKEKIMYVAIIAVIIGSAVAYMLAALILKPIKVLVHDAEVLGGGDLDHHIQVTTRDEVGTLASTLDATRVKLKDAQERLVVSERLARELEIAREIQMALLPKETPVMERVEVGALYRAAAQVGGDLYDFFWVSEDELGIVVADVSGKGVPGSMVMTMAKAIIRAKAVKSDAPLHTLPSGLGGEPSSVLRKTNQMLYQDIKKGMFITANYGILHVSTLQFKFVSAGHNDTLVYNSHTGELREYNPKGIALGLDQGNVFDAILQELNLSLSSGDLLIQFTDGITEAMNEQGDEFGDDRLKMMIQKYANQNVNEFLASLDHEIRAFAEGFAQNDDITAVAIKVK